MIISRGRVAGLSDSRLSRFVARVRKVMAFRGSINVLLTTSKEMKVLNSRFRGLDEATDVLSFPSEKMNDLAGEIAISVEIARGNAERLGHAPETEIKILILHGMLHLAGYDHETDHGEMDREENRLRQLLRLPAGLIERNRANSKTMRRYSKARVRRKLPGLNS